MARRSQDFQTIKSEGGLLPPDLLRRLVNPKDKLEGADPKDYGLAPGERLNDAITQSYGKLRKHWADFRKSAQDLPEGEPGTSLTNEKWSVPLLRELGFGMLPTSAAPVVDGKSYAINRFFGTTAVHLIGCQLDLDRRAKGVRGAAMANPHGLVQDFLNRSDAQLWAILSNGLRLRILRDSQAISRQSYLEFDLEAMFEGEVYADFVVLWMVANSTRFAARENERSDSCWLERWTKLAEEQGTRALGDLKQGVEKALQVLGQGFVGHPKNAALRESLRTGKLPLADLHGQLLRIVYRLIFLFVAEDRTLEGLPLLHPRDESDAAQIARERYATNYSAGRLREMANEIRGSRHGDLWWQLNLVFGALSDDDRFTAVRRQLALPVLGSFLWSPDSTAALNAPSLAANAGTELTNADLLEAIRNLAFTRQNHSLRPVDYKSLGAEELGGVYESLLALTPQISGDGAKFTFAEFAGNERKTSGSYYTPDSLVQCLLDSALEPVIEEALKGKRGEDAEKAILTLKVCDPAVGSGHFLVGAAHRLARHLARIRAAAQGEGEPSPGFYQHALRDVIGRCLYGVDINPMAAELCRVSLWLEALDPGKPLSFLDHHIRVGNSLLGTTPELIAGGLPDDTFTATTGDDKKVCAQLKKRNKAEREGFSQSDLLGPSMHGVASVVAALSVKARTLDASSDNSVDAVRRKADQFYRFVISPEYKHAQQIADAWCSAFFWPKTPSTLMDVITSEALKQLEEAAGSLTTCQSVEIERLSREYQFFHWSLAFPEVFANGGFDCLLGNPPWGQIEIDDIGFFAESLPSIATIKNMGTRKQAIAALEKSQPTFFNTYLAYVRHSNCEKHFLHSCNRYPLTSIGRLNSAPLFAELSRGVLQKCGRVGIIVPTGIATDSFNRHFFQDVVGKRALMSIISFENEEKVFPEVHNETKFCLLVMCYENGGPSVPQFAFFLRSTLDLADRWRFFGLSAKDIAAVNPNSRTCPVFRGVREAEITLAVHRRVPVLVRRDDNSSRSEWSFSGQLMFMMNSDDSRFVTQKQLPVSKEMTSCANVFSAGSTTYLPLYEGRMFSQFDHRSGTYDGQTQAQANKGLLPASSPALHKDPEGVVLPQYWIEQQHVDSALEERTKSNWLLCWRDVTSAVLYRTVVMSVLPKYGTSDSAPIAHLAGVSASQCAAYVSNMNSFVLDHMARQKLGGSHLRFFTYEQLPVLPPSALEARLPWAASDHEEWMRNRCLELTYTAWSLEPFAKDCDFEGPPFRWDEDRRFLLRAELDAAFFHLYLPANVDGDWMKSNSESDEDLNRLKHSFPVPRNAVDYIMETFPIVKKKDIEKYGDYRTKLQILEIYDEMQEATSTGTEYKTKLNPPPGDLRCCHPPREEKTH